VPEVDTTTSTGAATTGDGDNDELEVVMVHSGLRAPEHVSLSEAMSMSHFALLQAQDVLQREWVDVEEERRHLSEWGSLLKECTISEREKAVTKWEQLDEVERLLAQQWAAIDLLNTNVEKLLALAKELYVVAEVRGEANIKAQEDLSKQAVAITHQEQALAEREQVVQEKEEEIAGMLDRECSMLMSRETDLDTREAALEADQKSLADLRAEVLARELAADLKTNHLAF
jgi:hypothetical protein